jgi:hypothetical protein
MGVTFTASPFRSVLRQPAAGDPARRHPGADDGAYPGTIDRVREKADVATRLRPRQQGCTLVVIGATRTVPAFIANSRRALPVWRRGDRGTTSTGDRLRAIAANRRASRWPAAGPPASSAGRGEPRRRAAERGEASVISARSPEGFHRRRSRSADGPPPAALRLSPPRHEAGRHWCHPRKPLSPCRSRARSHHRAGEPPGKHALVKLGSSVGHPSGGQDIQIFMPAKRQPPRSRTHGALLFSRLSTPIGSLRFGPLE